MLNTLISRAIAGNLDLQQAVLRVVEAWQSVTVARSAGLPGLTGNNLNMRLQFGAKGVLQSKGILGRLDRASLSPRACSAIEGALDQLTQPSDIFQNAFDAPWKLDLFGCVRRST